MSSLDGFKIMYYELLTQKLTVTLVPSINDNRANNGCCYRAVIERNPKWYREFCSLFLDYRGKTIIKRQKILGILNRLSQGKSTKSKYFSYLFDICNNLKIDDSDVEDMQFLLEYGVLPEEFNEQF